MSKAEKRWNRIGKNLDWKPRPGGGYQAPPEVQPIGVALIVLMVALAAVAPKGVANTKGEAGAIGALIFLAIGVLLFLMIIVSNSVSQTRAKSTRRSDTVDDQMEFGRSTSKPIPTPEFCGPPKPTASVQFLDTMIHGLRRLRQLNWLPSVPEWIRLILWGLAISAPLAATAVYLFRRFS